MRSSETNEPAIPPGSEVAARGNVVGAGDLELVERPRLRPSKIRTVPYALLIAFPDADSLRAAIASGRAEFTVFGVAPAGEAVADA